MELMWGWVVVIAALAVAAPIFWWCLKEDEIEFQQYKDGQNAQTQIIVTTTLADMDTQTIHITSDIEPIVVDVRPIEREPVVDELGEWVPWEYELDQPKLLGHVLATRRWKTLTMEQMGITAS